MAYRNNEALTFSPPKKGTYIVTLTDGRQVALQLDIYRMYSQPELEQMAKEQLKEIDWLMAEVKKERR